MAFRTLAHKPRDIPKLQEKLADFQDKCELLEDRIESCDRAIKRAREDIKRTKTARKGITLSFDGAATSPGRRGSAAESVPPQKRNGHKEDPFALTGVNATDRSQQLLAKQMRNLETKLHNLKRRESEIDSQRKNLRITINMLRQEHLLRKEVYENLTGGIKNQQYMMEQTLAFSQTLYEEREQAIEFLIEAEEAADREEDKFQDEMDKLSLLIEDERKALEQVREDVSRNRRQAGQLRSMKLSTPRKAEVKAKTIVEEEEVPVYSYDQLSRAFKKLKDAMGQEDVEELVETFIKKEDENFGTFNYIQHLNRDIEKLEEQYGEVVGGMNEFQESQGAKDSQRKKMLDDLNDKLTATLKRGKGYERRSADAEAALRGIAATVEGLFTRLKCELMAGVQRDSRGAPVDRESPSSGVRRRERTSVVPSGSADDHAVLLPSTNSVHSLLQQGVSRMNVVQYMGIIEQRAAEIISGFKGYLESKDHEHHFPDISEMVALPAKIDAATVVVKAPPMLDAPDQRGRLPDEDLPVESDGESDGEGGLHVARPLSRGVLVKQAMVQVKRVEAQKAKQKPKDRGMPKLTNHKRASLSAQLEHLPMHGTHRRSSLKAQKALVLAAAGGSEAVQSHLDEAAARSRGVSPAASQSRSRGTSPAAGARRRSAGRRDSGGGSRAAAGAGASGGGKSPVPSPGGSMARSRGTRKKRRGVSQW